MSTRSTPKPRTKAKPDKQEILTWLRLTPQATAVKLPEKHVDHSSVARAVELVQRDVRAVLLSSQETLLLP